MGISLNHSYAAAALALVVSISACVPVQTKPPEQTVEAETLVQIGVNHMSRGELDLAQIAIEQALQQEPELVSGLNAAALVHERLNQPQAAESYFKQALEIAPGDPYTHNNYGAFLCNSGRFEAAEEHFLAAAADPQYETPEVAYINAGLCARRIPNLDRAADYFVAAVNANPQMPKARFQMARLHLEQGRPDAAQQDLERYLKSSPHTAQTLLLGVKIENQLGDPLAREIYMRQLRDEFPDSPEYQELLALEAQPKFTNVAPPVDEPAGWRQATVKDEAWLMQQNPGHYTLQLLAGRQKNALLKLIRGHALEENMAYFEFSSAGETWYSLVYGNYSSFEQAKAAIAGLPAGLREHDPWARRFDSIQEAIEDARL